MRRAIASSTERTDEKNASRMRWGSSPSLCEDASTGPSIPSRRPTVAARRSGGSACSWPEKFISAPTAASSFSQAASVVSPSTMPASARITSPSAQYTIPEPYGRQRPSRKVGGGWRWPSQRSSSWRRRDLPTPA